MIARGGDFGIKRQPAAQSASIFTDTATKRHEGRFPAGGFVRGRCYGGPN